jgi:hypothetical protein
VTPLKTSICIILACTALCGAPLAAAADRANMNAQPSGARGWLLGAGLGVIEYREPELHSTEPDFIYLQGGWRFNRHFMLEARVGTDAPGSGDALSFGMPLHVRVQQIYGIYARAAVPVCARCEVYGLLGYTGLRLQADADFAASHQQLGSASYGIGFSWAFSPGISMDLELLPELVSGTGWRSDALAVGVRWQM